MKIIWIRNKESLFRNFGIYNSYEIMYLRNFEEIG